MVSFATKRMGLLKRERSVRFSGVGGVGGGVGLLKCSIRDSEGSSEVL
jgi:hypothetical protein